MRIIGEQIRNIALKWVIQEQLGQIIGVTTQAVSNGNAAVCRTQSFCRVSHILSESIMTLFGDDDENELLNLARKINRLPVQEAIVMPLKYAGL